jgi:hypothetical protein
VNSAPQVVHLMDCLGDAAFLAGGSVVAQPKRLSADPSTISANSLRIFRPPFPLVYNNPVDVD